MTSLFLPHKQQSPNRARQLGRVLRSFVLLVVLVAIVVGLVTFVFGALVPMGSIGVRKIAFGPGQGLSSRALNPGLHWTVPGYSTVYLVPQTVQVVNFQGDKAGSTYDFPIVIVPTAGGTTVDVDVSLLARFHAQSGSIDGKQHGGPAELINSVGSTPAHWAKYIAQVAENEVKRALSSLSNAEFYNPTAREERVKIAEQEIRDRLNPSGIRVEALLLRAYSYREDIGQAIFKKNLQELEMSYNKVATEFAEAQRDVRQVETNGNVAIQNLDKQGTSEAEKIRSDGDLYRRRKIADGELLIAKAKAEVDRLKSDVLAKAGGDIFVAMQSAGILSSIKGGIVEGMNPLDVDSMTRSLSGASTMKPEPRIEPRVEVLP